MYYINKGVNLLLNIDRLINILLVKNKIIY
jgi:hypothetical protein